MAASRSGDREAPTLFGSLTSSGPLAARLRPTALDQVLGQDHLLGQGKPVRTALERGEITSMILWGPPGSGKTTLARLIAGHVQQHFEPFSAVTEGVPRVREIIAAARHRRDYEGRGTILFCDEIHRFNKAQQDAFLPWVEEGVITLIGATTENPSFAVNAALLSRVQVFVLEPLGDDDIRRVIDRAFERLHEEGSRLRLADDARERLVRYADGDARRVLNAIDALDRLQDRSAPKSSAMTAEQVESQLARRMPQYDRAGEQHFNLISALHKAVRGSDVEGALYWLARMIDAGEDVLYIARRVVRMAVEDIGLADPRALSIANAATEAYRFLGSPEGDLAVAEAVVYLATAPKSNRVHEAWGDATAAAREHPNAPVPLHLRNAPTGLMKELGYGKGYQYDPATEHGLAADQQYLPDVLQGVEWYRPQKVGFEKTLAERIRYWNELRARARAQGTLGPDEVGEGTGPAADTEPA